MAKKLRDGITIFVAPGITGKLEHGRPIIQDISSHSLLDPNSIDDKITIFEKQVNGWFLSIAGKLTNDDDAYFVVLMVATAYIESIQRNIDGLSRKGKSTPTFIKGFKTIFNYTNESQIKKFHDEVRCGLFHEGMTKGKVILNKKINTPFDFSDPAIINVNPVEFLAKVKSHFTQYIARLKKPTETVFRNNFNASFSNL